MKLHIANLGVVKEATIDLGKKLTVFCGPNGTGKTWTAYVIGEALDQSKLPVFPDTDEEDSDDIISLKEAAKLTTPMYVYNQLKAEMERLPDLVDRILPVAVEKREMLFGAFRIEAEPEDDFIEGYQEQEMAGNTVYGDLKLGFKKSEKSHNVHLQYNLEELSQAPLESMESSLIPFLTRSLAFYPVSSTYTLPVERNSIFTFNNELRIGKTNFLEAIKDSQEHTARFRRVMEFSRNRITRYPKAIRDALKVADDIANISRTASPYYDFGVEVEHSLLGGKVGVGEGGEVDFAPAKAGGKSFSFQLSSSAVKTLSSLIIYLKYQAKPNELLIIDEPELNLHPDNQVLLARVFARMIHKGIRLLISTHSDYIIRELNNLIMLSGDEPALRKVAAQYGYRDDERIRREDVGVYLFHFKNPEDKFVTVDEVEVSENGFEVATIEDTINRLNAVSEEIFYTMKYGEQVRDEQD